MVALQLNIVHHDHYLRARESRIPEQSFVVSLPVWCYSCERKPCPLRVCMYNTCHAMTSRSVRPAPPCHSPVPRLSRLYRSGCPSSCGNPTQPPPFSTAPFRAFALCHAIKQVIADETTEGPGTADETPPPMETSTTLPPTSETAPPSMGGTEMSVSEVSDGRNFFRFLFFVATRGEA